MVFGLLGAPLLAIWAAAVPDAPSAGAPGAAGAARPAVGGGGGSGGGSTGGTGAEKVTLGRLLSHPATWAIVIVNFVNHWGYFIYLNWMPTYFSKVCLGARGGGGEGGEVAPLP